MKLKLIQYLNENKISLGLSEGTSELRFIEHNKGYGTLKHRNGILKHGKHSLHRNLFLRKLLGNSQSTGTQHSIVTELLGNKKSNNTHDTTCAFLED